VCDIFRDSDRLNSITSQTRGMVHGENTLAEFEHD
jgi:hypothetical protein